MKNAQNNLQNFTKKKASAQIKNIMNNQKIFLKKNKNFKVNLQDTQATQKTVKNSKLHYNSIIIRQDKIDSIFILKKNVRFFFIYLFLQAE